MPGGIHLPSRQIASRSFEDKLEAYEHVKQEHFKGTLLEGFAEACVLDPIIKH